MRRPCAQSSPARHPRPRAFGNFPGVKALGCWLSRAPGAGHDLHTLNETLRSRVSELKSADSKHRAEIVALRVGRDAALLAVAAAEAAAESGCTDLDDGGLADAGAPFHGSVEELGEVDANAADGGGDDASDTSGLS